MDDRSWREDSGPALAEALVDVLLRGLAAAPPSFPQRATNDARGTVAALLALSAPTADLQHGAGTILLAGRMPESQRLVQGTLGSLLDLWLTPVPRKWTPREAAQAAYLLALSLGLILGSRHGTPHIGVLRAELARRVAAFAVRYAPRRLPEAYERHWDALDFALEDAARERLLQAAFDLLVSHGFESIQVARLADDAGVPRDTARSWYPTNHDLVADALRHGHQVGLAANEAAQDRLARGFGPGVAEAVMMREFMRPGREPQRAAVLEQIRMCWADPDLLASSQRELSALADRMRRAGLGGSGFAHVEWAMGLGVVALAVISPPTWQLPFDVVTVPLLEPANLSA